MAKPTQQDRELAAAQAAEKRRTELEEKGAYVSPKRGTVIDETVDKTGTIEPPIMTAEEMTTLAAAAELFADDLTDEAKEQINRIWPGRFFPEQASDNGVLRPKGLHRKLAEIMALASRIPKRGVAPAAMGGYSFVEVGDAADFIRPQLAERGITMMPHDLSTEELSQVPTSRGGTMTVHTIKTVWRLTDSETGEFYDLPSYGTGADTGDKFSPKAQTNSMKYALLMGFLLSTGDDPEASDLSEPATGPGIQINGSTIEQPRAGGRQRMATEPQVDAIRKRAGELGLTPEALVLLIGATLGGKAPDIDSLENTRDQSQAIIEFLGDLTFEECGKVVRAVLDVPTTEGPAPSEAASAD